MKSWSLVLILSLILLMGIPTPLITVRAAIPDFQRTWSPFGPRTEHWIGKVYSDFGAMFNAFEAGELDLADWSVFPHQLYSYPNNPDFYVSFPSADNGIRWISYNFNLGYQGKPFLAARTLSPTGLEGPPSSVAGCSAGFGRINLTLKNLEAGSAVVIDSLNKVTANGPQTFTVTDANVDGTYHIPSASTCMLAGTYSVSSTLYAGTASIPVGSASIVTATLNVNHNSPSTKKLTTEGIHIRLAIEHMLDKPNYVTLGPSQGNSFCADALQSPIQGGVGACVHPNPENWPTLPQSYLDEDKPHHPWFAGSVATNRNLVSDNVAGGAYFWSDTGAATGATSGYAGLSDLRAVCDHYRLAGFEITGAVDAGKDDCLEVAEALATDVNPGGAYPHLVPTGKSSWFVRTDPLRRAYGQIIADTENAIFGTPHVTGGGGGGTVEYGSPGSARNNPRYYSISQLFFIVLADDPNRDDWGMYTGGNAITTGFLDFFYGFFHSQFASDACGGPHRTFPAYQFFCDPRVDALVSAGQFSSTTGEADALFTEAKFYGLRNVWATNVFNLQQSFVALSAWSFEDRGNPFRSSLVHQKGKGWIAGAGGFWTALNMRAYPGHVPYDPRYVAGGGDPAVIRRGFSQDVQRVFPLAAVTFWDFEVYDKVWDSMLKLNPMTLGDNAQIVDWMTTSHSSTFNPAEVGCVGPPAFDPPVCVEGVTTQLWKLRNDLNFHDGEQVTAADVAYSILMWRDIVPGVSPVSLNVVSASSLNPTTVQVKLLNRSPFYENEIGGLPIMPKHIFEAVCGPLPNPMGFLGACADPNIDPMANGWMVGSGPWVCKEVVGSPARPLGSVGGSCVQNADGSRGTQEVRLGGRIILEANDDYMRGRPGVNGSSLHRLGWADGNDDGVVNIVDLANLALNFDQADPYWNSGENPQAPHVGLDPSKVDIGEVATLAFYFDHGTTAPFLPSQMIDLDLCIDPFFEPPIQC